jgi:hypothetical protein
MKLIYLDTSHIALLARELLETPSRINAFITKWRDKNFLLALSQFSFIEISEYDSFKIRNSRYNLLEQFLPIKFEAGSFYEKEIINCLISKKLVHANITVPFSLLISTKNDLIDVINFMEKPEHRAHFRYMAKMHEFAWGLESLRRTTKREKKRRLSDIPNDVESVDHTEEFKNLMTSFQQDALKTSTPINKEVIQDGFNSLITSFDSFSLLANEKGYRNTLGEFFGFDPSNKKILKKPIEEMLTKHRFSLLAHATSTSANIPVDLILKNVSLEECKGLWLNFKVRNHLVNAEDTHSSNEYDLEQIQYLPYVDTLFADRRIVDKTKRVLQRKDLIESLKNVSLPLKVDNSVKSFENILFAT